MDWFRAYHGITSDPKWPIVARKAKVSIGVVVSVWLALLESASEAEDRGSVANFDPETVDALYGYEDGTSEAVFAALLEKGLICDGRICAWDKRQPVREDDSAERVRKHRERKRQETQGNAAPSQGNAGVTPCNADVTHGNAGVTPQIREEKIREEKRILNTPPLTPQTGGEEGEDAPEACSGEEPGIEFLELREFCNRELRAEGPLAGFAEYRQLKAARDRTGASHWPGLGRILADISARKAAGAWNPGFEISLARYLREKTWLAPVRSRASPAPAAPTEHQRRQVEAREMARAQLARREQERALAARAAQEEMQHGQKRLAQ